MRFLTALAALALLAACATAAPSSAPPTQTGADAAAPSYSSLAAQLFASAGRADAPSQAEVERAIGAADIVRSEGAGAAWTYRLDSCALLLLFSADARGEMRLAEVHPSARQSGEPSPSVEQCAAEASARRS
ncbi:MAG TPA: hypothetical protein VEA80_19075 [Vitreimonas sp.]|uniref:hypothetical protein n=1 Tax=Vitreimonas sp. TaxID=3069702 RepID=UPI002D5C8ACF|nr:hypothetical protein [Vitreimonas sp.]HYD89591.1 hypothetical protein [Vitreimonas sp.]